MQQQQQFPTIVWFGSCVQYRRYLLVSLVMVLLYHLVLLLCWLCIVVSFFVQHQHHPRIMHRHAVTTMMDDFLVRKLDGIKRTFDALTERLADPDVANDRKQMLTLSRERAAVEKTVDAYDEWLKYEEERQSLVTMDQSGELDAEMKDMVRGEQKELEIRQVVLEKSITLMLLPSDPNDDRNVMLEVRAGTGGDEASLWAGDLVSIYTKYAEAEGWKVEHISETEGEVGGYKTCVLQITGGNTGYVYSKLKYEAGVHRVQRVPVTDGAGKIQTSTATVAVMPEVDEVEVNIR